MLMHTINKMYETQGLTFSIDEWNDAKELNEKKVSFQLLTDDLP